MQKFYSLVTALDLDDLLIFFRLVFMSLVFALRHDFSFHLRSFRIIAKVNTFAPARPQCMELTAVQGEVRPATEVSDAVRFDQSHTIGVVDDPPLVARNWLKRKGSPPM